MALSRLVFGTKINEELEASKIQTWWRNIQSRNKNVEKQKRAVEIIEAWWIGTNVKRKIAEALKNGESVLFSQNYLLRSVKVTIIITSSMNVNCLKMVYDFIIQEIVLVQTTKNVNFTLRYSEFSTYFNFFGSATVQS